MKLDSIYFGSVGIVYLSYGFVYLGILSAVPKYIHIWNVFIHTIVCLFLMYRYHPFRTQYKFEPFDAKLIFASALLLLFNTIPLPTFSPAKTPNNVKDTFL